MKVIILPEYDAVSSFAAELVCKRINDFGASVKDKKFFVLGLPTEMYRQKKVSFENVVTFNMDEYIKIPQNHPQSYHSFMLQNFLRHINIQPCNVHIPNGNAENLDVECANYEQQIKAAGGLVKKLKIRLFIQVQEASIYLLEIAFNEPGSSLSSRTHIQSLTVETIRANARFFDGKLEEVPKQALTVGVGTIMDAQEVLILVNGANKAYALHKCIESGISHMWTASAFQNHPKTTFVVDEDATLELKVKTVKYFKEIYASSALEALHSNHY